MSGKLTPLNENGALLPAAPAGLPAGRATRPMVFGKSLAKAQPSTFWSTGFHEN
ncbi:hypothetical protein [Pseudomonas sp. MPB26]|uniref:hypothetical protein n=1 Tax=Pseudomonas sp. MPB26 TaxID=3388491 RepID=UPI003984FD11